MNILQLKRSDTYLMHTFISTFFSDSDEFGLTVSLFAEIVLFNFMSLGSFDSIFDVKLQMDFQ